MEWNHGSYVRPVPPFVSPPDNSMGFLYNYYDHYPGLNMMKYPAVVGQGSSAHAMGSGYASGNARDQMGDQKKKRLSTEQYNSLESSFQEEVKLNPERKMKLAKELGLHPRQVSIWFQNRRARCKAKQLEQLYDRLKHQFEVVSNEKKQLKREFDVVSGENKHLQEEVSALKAMLKEVKSAMKNHQQVISTEILGEDTVESTSVWNRSSLLLTCHHHPHQQTIAPNEDHHPVNNYHAFSIADDYNPVEVMPPLPANYWNNFMPPSYS
ncbi:hypothetical protein RHGRI_007099 [Rhododendron griersonianum]|uniref:Homeobox-leucine zipper protein n=1 Tax=Rhododendron griersonianum TaxID=479676 RepID=A0AAV6KWR1_9ERIC|nr:hypothetical protein RHGRI_007099 [Rhododendron griersonianum]